MRFLIGASLFAIGLICLRFAYLQTEYATLDSQRIVGFLFWVVGFVTLGVSYAIGNGADPRGRRRF